MPFPIFQTQIIPAATDYVKAPPGNTVQAIPTSAYYFMCTGKTSSGNGKSYLKLLSELLTTSSGSVTWTVTLTSTFHVKFTHNSGASQSAEIDAGLAYQLGISTAGGYTPGTPFSLVVPAGAGGTTLFQSVWLWTPDMLVSNVGPQLFDPQICGGIKSSAGAQSRAPDQTTSSVSNGVQTAATYIFTGVQPYYKAYNSDADTVHQREDHNTWWTWGPSLGRRILFWKDRSTMVGVQSFSNGSEGTTAGSYFEFYPTDILRAAPQMVAEAPPNLVYWTVTIPLWQTERGIAAYT